MFSPSYQVTVLLVWIFYSLLMKIEDLWGIGKPVMSVALMTGPGNTICWQLLWGSERSCEGQVIF